LLTGVRLRVIDVPNARARSRCRARRAGSPRVLTRPATDPPTLPTVVIATRDRRDRLTETLDRIDALDERPPVVVVDNGSGDGTAAAVGRRHPWVHLIRSERPLGSFARTLGIRAAETPLVALTDDDSWWAPGALRTASRLFAAHPSLGLVAARIVVEPEGRLDPVSAAMRTSPLGGDPGLPGPSILGFLACGAVVRRDAFLACGGFHRRYGFGGEEHLLAVDLASAGWRLIYADDVVAHHEPTRGERPGRDAETVRNELRSAWLRRPLSAAVRRTIEIVARHRALGAAALLRVAREAPWMLRERRVVPAHVEASLRRLETAADT
jgi:GT2 family glycosyltransferase